MRLEVRSLQAENVELGEQLRQEGQAQATAAKARLTALEEQIAVLRAAVEALSDPTAEAMISGEASDGKTEAGRETAKTDPASSGGEATAVSLRPQQTRSRARKAPDEVPATSEQELAAKLRMLMAEVASQLQAVREHVRGSGAGGVLIRQAQQRLVEADRSIAQHDMARAETLAQGAAALLVELQAASQKSD